MRSVSLARGAGRAPTLTEELARLGYSHRSAPHAATNGKREITRAGRGVFEGTARETWEWLRRQERDREASGG